MAMRRAIKGCGCASTLQTIWLGLPFMSHERYFHKIAGHSNCQDQWAHDDAACVGERSALRHFRKIGKFVTQAFEAKRNLFRS